MLSVTVMLIYHILFLALACARGYPRPIAQELSAG
jgi:hypothetical protein